MGLDFYAHLTAKKGNGIGIFYNYKVGRGRESRV